MSSDSPERRHDLAESSLTIPSDSENYSANNELSPSPPSSSSSPLIIYSPPTLWGLLRGAAINLLLPFINGLMLGFGELLAHEAAFRLGWSGTKIFPSGRTSRSVGPGIEVQSDPLRWKRNDSELDDLTSLELRYASTTPEPLHGQAPPIEVANPDGFLNSELSSTFLNDITTSDLPPITEHIGYLKELGLDYGWGPTAFIQTLLEHVYIYTGTPWWASIIIMASLVRLGLLKGYIGAADTAGRLAVLTPHLEPVKARIAAAKASQDQHAMLIATEEMRGMFKSANVKMLKLAVPFINMPLGYGTIRLMRGMAALPVPGLDEGGFLWVKDLTLSDPYLILPLATGLAFHYTFKSGSELGTRAMMAPALQRFMIYGVPAVSSFFMLFSPGCMQLTFLATSLLSLTQASLFRQPAVRNFLGIQPLPSKPKPRTNPSTPYAGTMNVYQAPKSSEPAPPENRGIIRATISDLKDAASQLFKSAQSTIDSTQAKNAEPRRSKAELRHAQAYEEKRRRELAQEKFEVEQERKEMLQTRREAQKRKEIDQ